MSTATQATASPVATPGGARDLFQIDPKAAFEAVLQETERLKRENKNFMALAEIKVGAKGIEADNLAGVWRIAQMLAEAGMVPPGFGGKDANRQQQIAAITVAIAYGAELGIPPMQAIQCIMVVNNRPAVFGDAAKALCFNSGLVEYIYEREIGTSGHEDYGYECVTKRKGSAEERTTFTVADGKKASLWGKSGPWTFYPKRMLQLRARGFRLRDSYPDVLKGLLLVEEARDIPPSPPNDRVDPVRSRTESLLEKLMRTPELEESQGEKPPAGTEPGETPPEDQTQEPPAPDPKADEKELAYAQRLDEYRQAIDAMHRPDELQTLRETVKSDERAELVTVVDAAEILKAIDAKLNPAPPAAKTRGKKELFNDTPRPQ